jgi:thiamine transport system permease protein
VLGFTAGISALATAVTLALGVPTAYALHRLDLPGAGLLRALVVMPFVMPTVVVGVMFAVAARALGPARVARPGRLTGGDPRRLRLLQRQPSSSAPSGRGRTRPAGRARPPQPSAPRRRGPAHGDPARAGARRSSRRRASSSSSARPRSGWCSPSAALRYGTVETEIYLLTTTLLDLQGAAVLSVLQFDRRGRDAAPQRRARARARGTRPPGRRCGTPAVTRAAARALAGVLAGVRRVRPRPARSRTGPIVAPRREWTLANYRDLAGVDPGVSSTAWEALGTSWRIAVDAAPARRRPSVCSSPSSVTRRPRLPGRARCGCSTPPSCCRWASRR